MDPRDGETPSTRIANQANFTIEPEVALDFHNLHLMCSSPSEQKATRDCDGDTLPSLLLCEETRRTLQSADIASWSEGVPKLSEPQATPIPVVKIDYTKEFDSIMSFFRGIVQPTSGGGQQLELDSPRYCVLLAYVLASCPANYNAWRRKRDLIKTPQSFLLAAQQWWQLNKIPTDMASLGLQGAEVDATLLATATEKAWTNRQGLVNTLRQWTPHAVRDFAPGGIYCPIRAVRWELNLASVFCIKNHKNFQTFAHRKDLLTFATTMRSVEEDGTPGHHLFELAEAESSDSAASAVANDDWSNATKTLRQKYSTRSKKQHKGGTSSDVALSEPTVLSIPLDAPPMGAGEEKEEEGCGYGEDDEVATNNKGKSIPLTFSQFDDRPLCNLMLTFDTKNYHVWSYRAWYITFFPHLLATTAAFEDEMFFTKTMLDKDLFNNSAWCHRFFLLRRIFDPLHDNSSSHSKGGTHQDATTSGVPTHRMVGSERALGSAEEKASRFYSKPAALYSSWVDTRLELVLDEVFNTAFSYLTLEPNNEAPYSHGLGVLELFGNSLERAVLPKEEGGEGSLTESEMEEISKKLGDSLRAIGGFLKPAIEEAVALPTPLPAQPLLYLLFIGKLFETIQPVVAALEPAAVKGQTAVKYSERKPSLVGTFYGQQFSSAVVDALQRTLPWVLDQPLGQAAATEGEGEGGEEEDTTPVLGQMCLELLVAQLSALYEGDTIRRKYWRQQLCDLRDEYGLDADFKIMKKQ